MTGNGTTERVGILATWWRGDAMPNLPTEPDFSAERSDDVDLLADLVGISRSEAEDRLQQGHRAYLARLGDEVAGYGWSATRQAEVGPLGLSFSIPIGNRYLWDFVTRPRWRGRRVYPRLLQAILRAEESEAERFWIGYDWGNEASARGIARAGFQIVGAIDQSPAGLTFGALGPIDRARAGAAIFQVDLAGSGGFTGESRSAA